MATKQVATPVDDDDLGSTTPSGGTFSIRFQDIKGLEPIPDGKYDVVVREVKPGVSQTGNPKCDMVYVIEDAEDPALNGRRIYDTLSLAMNALWRVKAFMLALGYDDDFEGEIDPAEWQGEHLVVTVATAAETKINPETGKPYEPRPRVKAFAPAGSNSGIDDVLG